LFGPDPHATTLCEEGGDPYPYKSCVRFVPGCPRGSVYSWGNDGAAKECAVTPRECETIAAKLVAIEPKVAAAVVKGTCTSSTGLWHWRYESPTTTKAVCHGLGDEPLETAFDAIYAACRTETPIPFDL
jgi:hypothetical protein